MIGQKYEIRHDDGWADAIKNLKRLVRGGRRSNGHALRLKIFPVHLAVVKAIDEQHDLWRTNSRHVFISGRKRAHGAST